MNKEIINKLQKELDIAINKKETLKGGLGDVYRKSYYDLKDRIDEAIEYIESYMPNYDFDKTNLIKVLEILRGEENDA